ncbi:MAG: hypothetical protein V7L00_31605 [Nostoc sp.]|uniref:hypothetical protein n=1 Tax=Nostoc sp. TaxID=1180 RepID=UPI002FF51379
MTKKRQSPNQASKLDPIHPNAAGIDIGAQNHWVCVPSGRANECVRRVLVVTRLICTLSLIG